MTSDQQGALNGITVLDATQMLAGPIAGMRLGDLGADVIKIEPPAGEFNRSHGYAGLDLDGHSTTFLALNRNKRSISINLKDHEGRAVLYDLVREADVFVHNYRVGTVDRLGVDDATLRSLNPELIYCTISGYGLDGPGANRPGQDLVLQGYSGSMHLVGQDGDVPTPGGVPAVDVMTGYQAVIGVLAALQARAQSGEGQHVTVDMLSVVLDAQVQEMVTHLNTGELPQRREEWSAHAWVPAPYGVYRTADSWLTMAMCSLPVLGDALDEDRLRELTRYEDGFDHADEVYRLVRPRLLERKTQEWIDHFDQYNIWTGPVLDYAQVAADPQVRARNLIVDHPHPDLPDLQTVAPPLQLSSTPTAIHRPAPRLGEHTVAVLEEIGYRAERIEQLQSSGAIGAATTTEGTR